MGDPRARKPLIKSRRRVTDEGEEEGSVPTGLEEDSLSEGSIVSDADDDADGEGSDGSSSNSPVSKESETGLVTNGHSETVAAIPPPPAPPEGRTLLPMATGDTLTIRNGVDTDVPSDSSDVHFDDLADQDVPGPQESTLLPQGEEQSTSTNSVGRGRREHEEYKKRRDADPAFVPNRGGFFMHDHRSAEPGQNGFRPFGRGRGRGRPVGHFSSFANQMQPSGPTDSPWTHDLHESVARPPPSLDAGARLSDQERQKPNVLPAKMEAPNRSFSQSRQLGSVQVRVFFGGMTEPIVVSAVPIHQYTRLPYHRPPLRRDKPVRVSIPDMPIRYIFPKVERSFIFIPRALRPNQQGFGRTRGRPSFNGGYGGFGPLSSRRTSVYAGSGYSPSLALSRRSSLGREMSVDGGLSPAVPSFSRHPGVVLEGGKPIVRLPPSNDHASVPTLSQQIQASTIASSLGPTPASGTTALPENPSFTENRPHSLPMHHPKPERTLQVVDIESPATLDFNPPQQQQQQPFHQQMPMQMNPPMYQAEMMPYPHSRHPSHPSQHGTPLQQIPETAVHAQPFQPYSYQQPQGFYPQQYAPAVYYHPQQGPTPSNTAAPFVQGQQYFYPPTMSQVQQSVPEDVSAHAQTVPYETGGMVYYYNQADLAQGTDSNHQYPPASYVPPPVGMGGIITPPIHYYPPPGVYYPPQTPLQ